MKSNRSVKRNRRRLLQVAGVVSAASFINGLPFALRAASAADGKTKIGIVGSGKVGSAIGSSWIRAGHEVMFSSRHLEDDQALAASLGANAHAGTPREAAAFGEVVMISVPYHALPDVRDELGALIKGKVVIDTCNPFVWRDGELATWARDKGAGLASLELLPGARIVRAFNAIGYVNMGKAHEGPGRVGMPIASDDAGAVAIASPLIRDVGYEPVLVGGMEMGKYLMPGTPLAGEHSPEEIREIAATLN
jgi:predicted dinucleotide-binding enzyme